MVEHLSNAQLRVFLSSTGEGPSLTEEERITLAESFVKEAKKYNIKSIIHVGHESLQSVCVCCSCQSNRSKLHLCRSYTYFKPSNLNTLIEHLSAITSMLLICHSVYHIPRMNSAVRYAQST